MNQKLIKILDGHENISPKLLESLVSLKPDISADLIDLMTNTALLDETAIGNGYIPIVSAQILTEINNSDALKPMAKFWLTLDVMDYAFEIFQDCLVTLTKNHWSILLDLYKELSDKKHKCHLSDIFDQATIRNNETYKIHLECLKYDWQLSPGYIAEFQNKESLSLLFCKFDKHILSSSRLENQILVELKYAIEELGGELSVDQLKKYKSMDRIRDKGLENLRQLIKPTSSNKIGRNDPCPCGSSIKYKKCCLQSAIDN